MLNTDEYSIFFEFGSGSEPHLYYKNWFYHICCLGCWVSYFCLSLEILEIVEEMNQETRPLADSQLSKDNLQAISWVCQETRQTTT